MNYLRIHKWDHWQTYRKDRGQPPWIKVHRCLMRNAEWVALSDTQRGQLVGMWLLAADKNGKIPADPAVLKQLCHMTEEPDLLAFIDAGFIDDDANVTSAWRQADNQPAPQGRQDDADPGALPFVKDLPETNHRKSKKDPLYTQAFEAAWEAYERRGSKGAASRAYRDAINYVRNRDGEPEGDPQEWMLGRVRLWAEINAGKDRQYWKHFERWLRDRRYDFEERAERAASPEDREAREKRERDARVRQLMERQQ